MNSHPKKQLTPADIILVAVLVCLTAFLLVKPLIFPARSSGYFTVTTPEGAAEYSMNDSTSFTLLSCGVKMTVTVENGAVSVTHTSCPDKFCQSTGKISRAGQSIVCIPAEVVIRIGEGGHTDEDFIVG